MDLTEALAALHSAIGETHSEALTAINAGLSALRSGVEASASSLVELDTRAKAAEATAAEQATALTTFRDLAVSKYRSALSGGDATIEALLAGNSLEEVEARHKSVTEALSRVREQVTQQLKVEASGHVSSGGTGRVEVDYSALTPREKIKLGISGGK